MAKPTKQPRIVAEYGRNKNGEISAIRPEEIPALANLCKKITATIETGKDYRIVSKEGA